MLVVVSDVTSGLSLGFYKKHSVPTTLNWTSSSSTGADDIQLRMSSLECNHNYIFEVVTKPSVSTIEALPSDKVVGPIPTNGMALYQYSPTV